MQFFPGDLAACYGVDLASRAICWGTASPFAPRGLRLAPSHVAILSQAFYPNHEEPLWFESTMLCDRRCVLSKEKRRGVQAHRPLERLADYTAGGGRVDVYRLAPLYELSRDETHELRDLLTMAVDLGVHYDLPGALLSGTRCLKFSRFVTPDLDSLFCSELVAAVLQKVGLMDHENPMRFSPARLVRRLVSTGVYRLHEQIARSLAFPEAVQSIRGDRS